MSYNLYSMKPKVLIIYNQIFHYRIPIWNILAQSCDLTVAYSIGALPVDSCVQFKTMYLPCISIGKRVKLHKHNIRKLTKNYDVVIAYGDIAWLKLSTLPWFNKTKTIFWTIGVSASYDKDFDQDCKWDKIRCFFYNKADALVFYTDYPINKYIGMGVPKEKMFVAPNTVCVYNDSDIVAVEKQYILFIGTLYKQKGLDDLLESYNCLKSLESLPPLKIIGTGPDLEYVKDYIQKNELSKHITLCGAIYDNQIKAEYFKNAIACISPKQAGLSVLESMGYGVPFITTKNAKTGGEIFNIHNGEDGVILEDIAELTSTIKDIAIHPLKYNVMGQKAREYYKNNRTPEHMANGLKSAICYVLNTL